jgi:hypothetical protein
MDLFNPPKTFNYEIMIKDLDFSLYENPIIQVVWEDLPENFTQDKLKSVKHYFSKKYNTTNVNVLTKAKNVETDTMQSIDVSVNIADENYQLDLLKSFLESKGFVPIIALISPYLDLREELKSQSQVFEIYLSTSQIRGKEHFFAPEYNKPLVNFLSINTDNDLSDCLEKIKEYVNTKRS